MINTKLFMMIGGGMLLITTPLLAAKGTAQISGTTEGSDISGVITVEETKKGILVSGTLENVPAGDHGFHIHQKGDCGNIGKNAGGHYNPKGSKHGFLPKDGKGKAHMGALGNVTIDSDGKGRLDVLLRGVSLTHGKHNVAGRAFILHAKPDDFGQPTGNAGGRIGCGPILITE